MYHKSVCVHTTTMSVGSYLYFKFIYFTSPTCRNLLCRRHISPRKLKTRFRQYGFTYCLVRRCRRRPRHRSPRLDGYFFPSPHHKTSWRWRRRCVHVSVCARDFCHWLEKFMGGRKKTPDQNIFCENGSPS